MGQGENFRVLDPTVEPEIMSLTMAPSLETLEGKTIGLLTNGKVNGDLLLNEVVELLGQNYRVKKIVRKAKPNASRVVPRDTLLDLARECDAVITAIGD